MSKFGWTMSLAGTAIVAVLLAPKLIGAPAPATPEATVNAQLQVPTPVEPVAPQPEAQAALVEVVFVIDTTGSMGGLLDGAKETVWSIVDTFVSQTPRPEIRVGVVAYRDRGDTYVTKELHLTDDLDAVHGFIKELQADGGGDGPEAVGKALVAAVEDMPWTEDHDRNYRTIFLVGDAPAKAYPDEPTPQATVEAARQDSIFVNAVQCGNDARAASLFTQLATTGQGEFVAVAADGGTRTMVSPYDLELTELETELAATALPYKDARGAELSGKMASSAGDSLGTRASRRSVLTKLGVGAASGGGDLLADLKSGSTTIEDLDEAVVPDGWSEMTGRERATDYAQRLEKRRVIETKLAEVAAHRDGWVKSEKDKRKSVGDKSFDLEVEAAAVGKMVELGLVE